MKKILLFLLLTTTLRAEWIVLNNQTEYPTKQSKMAVQWASSAKEVDENNKALIYSKPLDPATLQQIAQAGKNKLTLPQNAQQFRILVWSQNEEQPDYTTNWVQIAPSKTYKLEDGYLIPVVLMLGSGC
ncbi:MAG: hypothetical protein JSS61_05555 [Verrucomicrobia bacterium]|nr:hypothetical protein [Verrucomicrobiota bacterium]